MATPLMKRGRLVWAKLNGKASWWPGMIIDGADVGRLEPKKLHTWIYWFGDKAVSQIPVKMVVDFFNEYNRIDLKDKRKRYKTALYEVLNEAALRINTELSYAKLEILVEWGAQCSKGSQKTYIYGSAISFVRKKKRSLESICIACNDPSKDIVDQHPLFVGGLCEECYPYAYHASCNLEPGKFRGLCIICGQGGHLVICIQKSCKRSYCRNCIECLISKEKFKTVLQKKRWYCYLCEEKDAKDRGLIFKKDVVVVKKPRKLAYCPPLSLYKQKRPIKVISFNEIGSAVLYEMGCPVEKFYIFHPPKEKPSIFNDHVQLLGSMNEIDSSEIAKVVPVDLMIGLTLKSSLFFTQNKASSGIGQIFHEFNRAMQVNEMYFCKTKEPKRLFWIFMSDVILTDAFHKDFTRFMLCDPIILTVRLNHAYYVWTNIPGADQIAAKISAKAHISHRVPTALDQFLAEKDEVDILRAFLSPLVPYFQLSEI